nr:hypothetical protein [Tanacetum cinerariifolium]
MSGQGQGRGCGSYGGGCGSGCRDGSRGQGQASRPHSLGFTTSCFEFSYAKCPCVATNTYAIPYCSVHATQQEPWTGCFEFSCANRCNEKSFYWDEYASCICPV